MHNSVSHLPRSPAPPHYLGREGSSLIGGRCDSSIPSPVPFSQQTPTHEVIQLVNNMNKTFVQSIIQHCLNNENIKQQLWCKWHDLGHVPTSTSCVGPAKTFLSNNHNMILSQQRPYLLFYTCSWYYSTCFISAQKHVIYLYTTVQKFRNEYLFNKLIESDSKNIYNITRFQFQINAVFLELSIHKKK